MNDQCKREKNKAVYSEKELVERLTPYLAHADELEGLSLSDEEFGWILGKLENPPEPSPKLRELLERKAPWE